MHELLVGQVHRCCRCGGGAERADRTRGVPKTIVRGHHRYTDACRDFIADDHCTQKTLAGSIAGLRCRERGGNGRTAGVVARVAVDVVELDRMRRGTVDQRRDACGGAPSLPQPRSPAIEIFGERLLQQRRRRAQAARQQRRIPIDHRTLRVMHYFCG